MKEISVVFFWTSLSIPRLKGAVSLKPHLQVPPRVFQPGKGGNGKFPRKFTAPPEERMRIAIFVLESFDGGGGGGAPP